MADISMCMNHDCPSNAKCYRYTAKANPNWQSYSQYKHKNKKCDSFWDNKGR